MLLLAIRSDRQRRVVARLADRLRHAVDGRRAPPPSQASSRPPRKLFGIDSAQHQIGVGDGRLTPPVP